MVRRPCLTHRRRRVLHHLIVLLVLLLLLSMRLKRRIKHKRRVGICIHRRLFAFSLSSQESRLFESGFDRGRRRPVGDDFLSFVLAAGDGGRGADGEGNDIGEEVEFFGTLDNESFKGEPYVCLALASFGG